MSLPIIQVTSPQIPFVVPLPGFMTNDKLQLSVNLTAKSSLEISLKASDSEKIDSRIPLNLFVTLNGITCRCGKNKKWDVVQKNVTPIPAGTFLITITSDSEEEYHVEVDGNLYATFPHKFPPFASEFLEVKVCEGSAQLKSVLYTREMKWIGTRIGLPLPETALKCGKDDQNNDIYVGRGLKNNNLLIVSAKPTKNEAFVAYDGREWPIHHYELLQDNIYFGWTIVNEDKKIPENAVEGGFTDKGEKIFIGRVMNGGCVIPGSLNKITGFLSVPFKGKELKFSSRFEVLTVLSPMEVKNKKKPQKFEPKADTIPKETQPKKEEKCIACVTADIDCAFIPCGHLVFCEKCVREFIKGDSRCPMCRKPVTSQLKIFKAV